MHSNLIDAIFFKCIRTRAHLLFQHFRSTIGVIEIVNLLLPCLLNPRPVPDNKEIMGLGLVSWFFFWGCPSPANLHDRMTPVTCNAIRFSIGIGWCYLPLPANCTDPKQPASCMQLLFVCELNQQHALALQWWWNGHGGSQAIPLPLGCSDPVSLTFARPLQTTAGPSFISHGNPFLSILSAS